MLKRSEFVVVEHKAKRAGLHYDLRIKKPNSNMWASFALRKGVPETPGKRHLSQRQDDHTRKDALVKGEIKKGRGAGFITHLERAPCDIVLWKDDHHIRVDLKGKKFKGIYHIVKMPQYGKTAWFVSKAK